MTESIWSPGPARRQTANIRRFIEWVRTELDPGVLEYQDLHRYSLENPAEFWRAIWEFCEIVGAPGTTVVENFDQMPGARWFPGASLNFAENLLRHFGGLRGVAQASLEELQQVKGLGRVKAIEVKAALELGKRIAVFIDRTCGTFAQPRGHHFFNNFFDGIRFGFDRAGERIASECAEANHPLFRDFTIKWQALIVYHHPHSAMIDDWTFLSKVKRDNRNVFESDILPDIQLGPVG